MSLSYLPRPLPSLLSSPLLVRGFQRHQTGSKVLYGWGAQGSLCRRDRASSSSAFPAFHGGESRRCPACAPDAPRTQTEAEEREEKRWGGSGERGGEAGGRRRRRGVSSGCSSFLTSPLKRIILNRVGTMKTTFVQAECCFRTQRGIKKTCFLK